MGGSSNVFQAFLSVQSIEMHNNAFVKIGASMGVFDDVDASWVNGRKVFGSKNWISTGATKVPTEWTQGSSGADPGFVDLGNLNLRLLATSPLLGAGVLNPQSLAGLEFPRPLGVPMLLPPMRAIELPGQAKVRGTSSISIGAFEK